MHTERRLLVAIIASAFAARLVWVIAADPDPISDMRFYYEQGRSIAEGMGYVSDGAVNGYSYPEYPAGAPTADRPVGYPAFLALLFTMFGSSVLAGQLANVFLSTAVVLLLYGLARRLGATVRVAGAAGFALAFFPNQIAYCGLLSDSILFQFLLMLGFYLIVRFHGWVAVLAVGVVFGLATLTRAYAILLPLLWGWLTWSRLGGRAAMLRLATVVLAIGAVVAPWSIRNYRVFGEFAFVSTNLGHNLLSGHNAECRGQWVARLPSEAYAPGFRNEVERDHALRRMALAYAIEHPLRTVAMSVPKLFYMYVEDADGLRWTLKGRGAVSSEDSDGRGVAGKYGVVELAGMAIFEAYYLVFLLGFLGALVLRGGGHGLAVDPRGLGLWTVAYFSMIAVVFFGMSRFHYPIVPFVVLYATAFYLSRSWIPARGSGSAQERVD